MVIHYLMVRNSIDGIKFDVIVNTTFACFVCVFRNSCKHTHQTIFLIGHIINLHRDKI